MKLIVQWSTDPDSGLDEIDSSQWGGTPKKDDPTELTAGTNGIELDAVKGWVNLVYVHALGLSGDHYCVRDEGDRCKVLVWDDDPDDFPGKRRARVWTFGDVLVKDGEWTADQWDRIFVDHPRRAAAEAKGIDLKELARMLRGCNTITEQHWEFFGELKQDRDDIEGKVVCNGAPIPVHPWSEFAIPLEAETRHGVYTEQRLFLRQEAARPRLRPRMWA